MRRLLARLPIRLTRHWAGDTVEGGDTAGDSGSDPGVNRALGVLLPGFVRRSLLAKVGGVLVGVVPGIPALQVIGLQVPVTDTVLLMAVVALFGFLLIVVALHRDTVRGLTELREKAETLADGEYDGAFDSSREDEVGRVVRTFGEMRDSLRSRIEAAEAERTSAKEAQAVTETELKRAESAAAETERFARRLEDRAGAFGVVMAECAQGDLTRRLDADADTAADSEAMQDVAVAFNETITEIEHTVADVVEFADQVATASKRVREHAMQASDAGQGIAGSIDQIADGAATQDEQLQGVSSDVDELSATIEEVAVSADEVAATSRAAASSGNDGRDAARDAVRELHDIMEQTEETAAAVAALDEQMDRIGDIVDVITRIADQTNILALNARIEAARAGEAGDGFAVVSNEVKQLAEETQESAAEIESRIETVQEQTADSVAEMTRIEDRVRDGVETVEETQDALESVVDRVDEADVGVQEISRAMDEQASAVGDIAATIDELATISEETTSEASTVANAAGEQAATLGVVSENTEVLVETADALEHSLHEFTTCADVDARRLETGDAHEPSVAPDEPATSKPVRTDGSTTDVGTEAGGETGERSGRHVGEGDAGTADGRNGDEADVFEWVSDSPNE